MYRTQPFSVDSSGGREGKTADSDDSNTRRVKLLAALQDSSKGMTTFELSVKAGLRPDAIATDVRVMFNIKLMTVDGTGDDAVTAVTA